MTNELKRRNISGINIFDTFPNEERRKPTCVEDCQQATRRAWCMSKEKDYLRNTISALADSFRELVEYCHTEGCVTDEQREGMNKVANSIVDRSKWNWSLHELADQVDLMCEKIRLLADAVGVTRNRAGGEG